MHSSGQAIQVGSRDSTMVQELPNLNKRLNEKALSLNAYIQNEYIRNVSHLLLHSSLWEAFGLQLGRPFTIAN